jgi:hypothetical protein
MHPIFEWMKSARNGKSIRLQERFLSLSFPSLSYIQRTAPFHPSFPKRAALLWFGYTVPDTEWAATKLCRHEAQPTHRHCGGF